MNIWEKIKAALGVPKTSISTPADDAKVTIKREFRYFTKYVLTSGWYLDIRSSDVKNTEETEVDIIVETTNGSVHRFKKQFVVSISTELREVEVE